MTRIINIKVLMVAVQWVERRLVDTRFIVPDEILARWELELTPAQRDEAIELVAELEEYFRPPNGGEYGGPR